MLILRLVDNNATGWDLIKSLFAFKMIMLPYWLCLNGENALESDFELEWCQKECEHRIDHMTTNMGRMLFFFF